MAMGRGPVATGEAAVRPARAKRPPQMREPVQESMAVR